MVIEDIFYVTIATSGKYFDIVRPWDKKTTPAQL